MSGNRRGILLRFDESRMSQKCSLPAAARDDRPVAAAAAAAAAKGGFDQPILIGIPQLSPLPSPSGSPKEDFNLSPLQSLLFKLETPVTAAPYKVSAAAADAATEAASAAAEAAAVMTTAAAKADTDAQLASAPAFSQSSAPASSSTSATPAWTATSASASAASTAASFHVVPPDADKSSSGLGAKSESFVTRHNVVLPRGFRARQRRLSVDVHLRNDASADDVGKGDAGAAAAANTGANGQSISRFDLASREKSRKNVEVRK